MYIETNVKVVFHLALIDIEKNVSFINICTVESVYYDSAYIDQPLNMK